MATRADAVAYDAIREVVPDAVYHEKARIVTAGPKRKKSGEGSILVVSAGTADIPVAEEAAVTAEIMGNDVVRLYDVGVAGIAFRIAVNVRLVSIGDKGAIVAAIGDGIIVIVWVAGIALTVVIRVCLARVIVEGIGSNAVV